MAKRPPPGSVEYPAGKPYEPLLGRNDSPAIILGLMVWATIIIVWGIGMAMFVRFIWEVSG